MAYNSFILGTDATVGVAAEQTEIGGAFTDVGGLLSLNMTITHDTVDFSNNDADYDLKRYGRQRVTGSFDFLYDPVDVAQALLVLNSRTAVITALRLRPEGSATLDEYSFDAILTSLNVTTENNGRISATVNFESTAEISFEIHA